MHPPLRVAKFQKGPALAGELGDGLLVVLHRLLRQEVLLEELEGALLILEEGGDVGQ